MELKDMKFSLSAGRAYSNIPTKKLLQKMKHSSAWLSLIETGKRRVFGDELIELFTIYGLDNLRLNQIFLPTKSPKRKSKNKKKIKKQKK